MRRDSEEKGYMSSAGQLADDIALGNREEQNASMHPVEQPLHLEKRSEGLR
jgi:hypothetical protein